MNEKLLKPYDSKNTEARIYKLWEESGFFNPDNLPENKKNVIKTPPTKKTAIITNMEICDFSSREWISFIISSFFARVIVIKKTAIFKPQKTK